MINIVLVILTTDGHLTAVFFHCINVTTNNVTHTCVLLM